MVDVARPLEAALFRDLDEEMTTRAASSPSFKTASAPDRTLNIY